MWRTALVKRSDELAKIPIDEHASAAVRFIVDNHDIPHANVAMKDADLGNGLVG
jgi:hypothetical protein